MNHGLKREANSFSFADPILNNKFKLAKQTLNELIINCDEYGVTFIGIRALAVNTGKSIPTIQKHIEILEFLGVVKTLDIKGSFGKKSHRQISFNVQPDVKPDVQVDVQVDVKPDVQVDVHTMYTEEKIREEKIREGLTAPLPSVVPPDTHTKTKKGKTKTNQQWIDYIKETYEEDAVAYAIDFINYREQIKAPIKTEQAISLYMNEVAVIYEKYGISTLDKEIDRMKAGAWKTLYPEYKNKGK